MPTPDVKNLDGTAVPGSGGPAPRSFKTEADRATALSQLPDRPPANFNGSLDEWQSKQDTELDAIEKATIGESGPEASSGEGSPNGAEPAKPRGYREDDWTVITAKGEKIVIPEDAIPSDPEFSFRNPKAAFKGLVETQRYFKTIKKDQEDLASKNRQLQQERDDLAKRLEGAGTPPKPNAPASPGEVDLKAVDAEIATTEAELTRIESELSELGEFDEGNNKLLRDQTSLMRKLNGLERKANKAMFSAVTAAETNRIAEQRRLEAKKEVDRKRQDDVKDIEDFRKANKLDGDGTYQDLETRYLAFGKEVAAVDLDKKIDEVTEADIERSLSRYLNRAPSLMDSLGKKGILAQEPKGMKKYLITSEVDMLRRGFQWDSSTGQWKPTQYKLPTLKLAYDYWKELNGERGRERIDLIEKTEKEVLESIQPRGAAEIPSGTGAQRGSGRPGMTKTEALDVLLKLEKEGITDKAIEIRARANPDDPIVKQYEEAVAVTET
jgi:predicted transcriptional regulator